MSDFSDMIQGRMQNRKVQIKGQNIKQLDLFASLSEREHPVSAPKTAPPVALEVESPDEGENAKLLAALAGIVGGSGAQALARRLGATTASVRQRLEALCADGLLVKCGARYRLAKTGGSNK